jgi:GT2 family glycosyltransferase
MVYLLLKANGLWHEEENMKILFLSRFLKLIFAMLIFVLSISLSVGLYLIIFIVDKCNKKPKKDPKVEMNNPDRNTASIIIVNFNGRKLLEECLPSVIEAVKWDGKDHEIIVVDNGSSDGSTDFVRERFPGIKIIELEKNYYFVGGNNIGIKTIINDIVILINNDMVVDKNFIRPLLNGFTDSNIFAVSSQIFLSNPEKFRCETGKTSGKFIYGEIEYAHDPIYDDNLTGYYPIYWAGGGSSAYDKTKFLSLGGFNPIFNPCYTEDADISHLAWKHGWRVMFTPESKVYHRHRATNLKLHGEEHIDIIIQKNKYLLIWKNISDHGILQRHFLFLPLRLAYLTFTKKGLFGIYSFVLALKQLPEVLINRIKMPTNFKISDNEILSSSRDYRKC